MFGVTYTLSKSLDNSSNNRDIVPDTYNTSNLAFTHINELLTVERMERVSDAHKTRCCDRNTCILD
jgi:hypothetical protein